MEKIDMEGLINEYLTNTNSIPFDENVTIFYPALIEFSKQLQIQTIDLCAETQRNEYKSLGLTNSGLRVNDKILKLKDDIL